MGKIKPDEWDMLATWINHNACSCIDGLEDGKELKAIIVKNKAQEIKDLDEKIENLVENIENLVEKIKELKRNVIYFKSKRAEVSK